MMAEFALQGPRKRGNAAIDGRPRANDQDARPGDAYGGLHSVPLIPISYPQIIEKIPFFRDSKV